MDATDLLQFGGIVFAAGILWERLNALNKKVTEQNGKLSKALVNIAELRVGQSDNREHLVEIRNELSEHITWANTVNGRP